MARRRRGPLDPSSPFAFEAEPAMNDPELVNEHAPHPAGEAPNAGPNGTPPAPEPDPVAPPVAAAAPPAAEPITSPYSEPPAPPVAAFAPSPIASVADAPAPKTDTESLEERLRRLEKVLSTLGDGHPPEARVATHLPSVPEPPTAQPFPSPAVVLETGKRWLPGVIDMLRFPGAAGSSGPGQAPQSRPGWLLFDLMGEAQSILHMYGDPRYRLTWPGRLIPPALLAMIFTSWIWLPGTSLMMTWMGILYVKVVDLILAFFLFKVLGREAKHYRELIPQYPPISYPPRQ
ncbi:MAG: hypothetical protein K2R98_08705 [Gemmataceae bacterium]|nr:hypothetical protein [Gemmataceae bacterium]